MNTKVFKIKLQKGDTVVVRSGKYRGRSGKVVATHPTLNKVTVEGINIIKRHTKPTTKNPQGGILEVTKPIWVGKVGLQEPTSKKPSKIGSASSEKGVKSRIYKRTNKEVK